MGLVELEKRLHNVECMLMTVVSLLKELLPPDTERLLGERQGVWFVAAKEMGAFDVLEIKFKETEH